MSIEEQFRAAMARAGIQCDDPIVGNGEIQRFMVDGDRPGSKNGWYVLHIDGVPAGKFGSWRTGLESTWVSSEVRSEVDSILRSERMAQLKRQRDAEKERAHREAAQESNKRWETAAPASEEHPYLAKKGIRPHGTRQMGDVLLVPLQYGPEASIVSLQAISPDSSKRFIPGGRVGGAWFLIGDSKAGIIVICEGFATGASIHEATGLSTVVAFNAGNLTKVAEVWRSARPDAEIIIAADDDWQTDGNPGLTNAREAAAAVGGYMVAPVFDGERGAKDSDFNDMRARVGDEAVANLFVTTGGATHSGWPEPAEIKSSLPPAPAFDAEALLPKTLAAFVMDEADRMPCSPDYIAAALVVSLGSVIGTKLALKPKRRDDWIVTPNLFGGVVGDPSSKKTPSISTVTRFLDRLGAKESEILEDRTRIYEAELAAYEAHEKAVKSSMQKAAAGKPDRAKMDAAIADLQGMTPPEQPRARRFKTNDATIEKIGEMLVHNPVGILVFRDELIGLLSSWDKEGREGDKTFYLEGWNGTGSFNVDRIGRGEMYIKSMCLSVFGGIQPDLLEKYLSNIAGRLDNDGRIQRFQVLVYPEQVQWEWRDRYPVDGAREAVRDLFDRLAAFDPLQDGARPADDFVKLPHVMFDEDAQEVFVEWSTQLNTVLIPGEQNPLMRQHWGKYEKLFCALALVLHLAEGRIGNVTADSAIRAAAWCEYLAGHARRIYELVEVAKTNAAIALSRRIKSGKLKPGFTARDVRQKGWAGLTEPLEVDAALSILEEAGHVKSYESQAVGRPTTRFLINPALVKVAAND